MNIINIKVYANRKLSKKTVDIGNMQEHEVTKLIFELDEDIVSLGGNVYLFVSYDGSTYPYPLTDNSFTVGRELTQRKKTEANIVVSTSEDEEDPLNGAVWISNTLTLLADKNSINIDSINEQELPPSLQIIYNRLFALEADLQEKKENDYWRGEKGPDGKSAYEYALAGGFEGTEKEFTELVAKAVLSNPDILEKRLTDVEKSIDELPIKSGSGTWSAVIGGCEDNIALGDYSTAEGGGTQAKGHASRAGGGGTIAEGPYSDSGGHKTIARGPFSSTGGLNTVANGYAQHVHGLYNVKDDNNRYLSIIGIGATETEEGRANGFSLDWFGKGSFASEVASNGADYAEFFEWLDGNPNNEDRVGYIVSLDGEKIKLANDGDEILGIISATPAVLGDNYEWQWNGKYLTDDFGRIQYESVEEFIEVLDYIDEETKEPIMKKESVGFFKRPILNPDYDSTQIYVNRTNRPEWSTVGMLGKLHVRGDGTCEVNGYVKVGVNGIATASTEKTNMRVLSRVNEKNIVRVLLK